MKRKYLNKGKLDIAIMDEITIENNHVTARINISEGKTYFIQNINIIGLKSIEEKYVWRELLFSNGDLYDIEKIDDNPGTCYKIIF